MPAPLNQRDVDEAAIRIFSTVTRAEIEKTVKFCGYREEVRISC